MNKVFLKGNVGHTPKITSFKDGGKVAQFTLATTERGYTRRDGTKVEDTTDWHNIVVKQSGLADVVEKYVQKGTPLLVIGKLRTRKYTSSDGGERTIVEVVVEEMELCGGKREDAPAPAPEPRAERIFPDKQPAQQYDGGPEYDDLPPAFR